MDMNLFRKHLATNTPKKLNEAANYTVVRTETIPHEETHTGLAGTKKTIKNPNGGSVVVLLKFNDGHTTTGVGKNKNEAIKDAVSSKLALFGESFAGDNKAALKEGPILPPDKKGTILIKGNKKVDLAAGDVVDIKTTDGRVHKNVTLTGVIDDKYAPLGGKVRFKLHGGLTGLSANGIASIEKVK